MLLRSFLVQLCLWGPLGLLAQQPLDDRNPEPVEGDSILIAYLHKINFTDAQLEELCQFRLTINFKIDKSGKSYLTGIDFDGNINSAIRDSLSIKAFKMNSAFYPRIQNGVPVNSTYPLPILFSCPGNNTKLRAPFPEDKFDREKIKSYNKSFKRLDVLAAVMTTQFAGNIASYLEPSIGFKLEIMAPYAIVNMGMVATYSEHNRKIEYPDVTSAKQDSSTTLFSVGMGFNRAFTLSSKQDLIVQFEMMYAGQTIVHKNYYYPQGILLTGWSPGLTVNYLLQISKNQFLNSHRTKSLSKRPSILQNSINFHVGIKKMNFKSDEASGWMYEFGIGIRLGQIQLKHYELK